MLAQQLYEGIELGKAGSVGLITYMRTDSVRISETAQTEAKEYILANSETLIILSGQENIAPKGERKKRMKLLGRLRFCGRLILLKGI